MLCVSDLLIHLSGDQMKKTLAEGIAGEQLNVIMGTIPLPDDDGADRVKLAVLNLLHETYGIIEEDFLSAELTIVPAGKCREVGLEDVYKRQSRTSRPPPVRAVSRSPSVPSTSTSRVLPT